MIKFLHVSTLAVLLFAGFGQIHADDRTHSSPHLLRDLPEQWTWQPESTQTLPTDDEWWRSFHDATLDSLVLMGVANNFNLLEASHRRELARLAMKSAQSGYYPTISASAGYSRSYSGRTSSNGFNLGATANWEIDVFGRITSQVKAKRAAYRASRADYVASMVSIVSDIATYYIKYRVLQQEVLVAREHLENQKRVLTITEARHEAGLVSKLDVTQAKTVLLNTEASIPSLESQEVETINALAILLGVYSADLRPVLDQAFTMPSYQQIVPVGVPADLLRRRPDVVAAEAQLAQYAAQLGIAKKDFLPTLSLQGNIGWSGNEINNMVNGDHLSWSIAPKLSWTIFEGFSRKYAVASAKEQMLLGVDAYNLTVMNAFAEVENAMSSYNASVRILELNQEILAQSRQSFDLAMEQYKQGLSAFTNVVNAQNDWLTCANTLVSAHGSALISLIDLYKSLGGGY